MILASSLFERRNAALFILSLLLALASFFLPFMPDFPRPWRRFTGKRQETTSPLPSPQHTSLLPPLQLRAQPGRHAAAVTPVTATTLLQCTSSAHGSSRSHRDREYSRAASQPASIAAASASAAAAHRAALQPLPLAGNAGTAKATATGAGAGTAAASTAALAPTHVSKRSKVSASPGPRPAVQPGATALTFATRPRSPSFGRGRRRRTGAAANRRRTVTTTEPGATSIASVATPRGGPPTRPTTDEVVDVDEDDDHGHKVELESAADIALHLQAVSKTAADWVATPPSPQLTDHREEEEAKAGASLVARDENSRHSIIAVDTDRGDVALSQSDDSQTSAKGTISCQANEANVQSRRNGSPSLNDRLSSDSASARSLPHSPPHVTAAGSVTWAALWPRTKRYGGLGETI